MNSVGRLPFGKQNIPRCFHVYLTDVLLFFIPVKGLWTDKPPCWPHDLPFADPNNGKARPKKDVLVKTAEFLIKVINFCTPTIMFIINS